MTNTTALTTLTQTLAAKLDMGTDGAGLVATLKATTFKGQVSDAQMTALLVVANQYGLNPWTREIYAFPDKNNGIVPVVGVDGWSRIINSHPQFDGMDFEQDASSCTCIIYRKDRSHPVKVTEWADECERQTGPWKSHPRRMLRHKAMIQCARLAFGYVGIYDTDEAERIVESIDAETGEVVRTSVRHTRPAEVVKPAAIPYDDKKFDANFQKWAATIQSGKHNAAYVIDFAAQRGSPFTEEQKARLLSVKAPSAEPEVIDAAPVVTYAAVADALQQSEDPDALDAAADLIGSVSDPKQRTELSAMYEERKSAIEGVEA